MKLSKTVLFSIIFMAVPAFAWPQVPVAQTTTSPTRAPIISVARGSLRTPTRSYMLRGGSQSNTIDLPAVGGANREIIKTAGAKNPLAIKEEPPTILDNLLHFTQVQSSW